MTEISVPLRSGWTLPPQGSCGRPRDGYPGYEVRVVDEHDQPVAPGEVGELVVRTRVPWTLTAGYLAYPERTAEAWCNGWFHTGDGFKVDEDGWYYFVDRLKDAIRRRGENISSFEVEMLVCAHPDVAECAAIAVPDRASGDEVKVCVVPHPGRTLDPRELVEFLIPRMPRFMVPRYVEVVDALPKTEATARVRKAELRRQPLNERTWDRVAAKVVIPREPSGDR
jgi:crotonobetaine/carnitine-CoA ligase